jgi:hypothetical protein
VLTILAGTVNGNLDIFQDNTERRNYPCAGGSTSKHRYLASSLSSFASILENVISGRKEQTGIDE